MILLLVYMKISAIVPAFNEQKNIKQALQLLKKVPGISEIIVVDDGSDDLTAKLARSVPGVVVISLPENLGKTYAVLEGVRHMTTQHLILIDADLFGLEKRHLDEVIETYKQGFDMVILDYGNQELYLRKVFKAFPALSGVRVLSKKLLKEVPFLAADRFELENRINTFFLETQKSIIVVTGDTVRTPHKFEKYSFYKGLYLEAKALKEIFLSLGARNIGTMIQGWWKINTLRKPIDDADI